MPQYKWLSCINEYLAIDSGGNVTDLVVARNCCMARMLPGEAELVSEWAGLPGGGQKCTALWAVQRTGYCATVVPALGDPRREQPPDVYGHVIKVPSHLNVKLPAISGHLPNADAESHLLVVPTCYNGQCKQMPRFRWSFQPNTTS